MLISGIAILRLFGIHYVFKDITAEKIVTLKGVSKTDALQGTLFMISVTISVIMFGIGGEYQEDGTWALLGACGFQMFFVIFILIEMGRMLFYKVGERENLSMRSSIRKSKFARFSTSSGGNSRGSVSSVGSTSSVGVSSFGSESSTQSRLEVGKRSSIWDGGTKGLQIKRSSLESVGYKHDLERVKGKMLISGGGGEGEENVMSKMDFDPGFF